MTVLGTINVVRDLKHTKRMEAELCPPNGDKIYIASGEREESSSTSVCCRVTWN